MLLRSRPIQLIPWWPEWQGIRFHRWTGGIAHFLSHSYLLGWWEIRVWRKLP